MSIFPPHQPRFGYISVVAENAEPIALTREALVRHAQMIARGQPVQFIEFRGQGPLRAWKRIPAFMPMALNPWDALSENFYLPPPGALCWPYKSTLWLVTGAEDFAGIKSEINGYKINPDWMNGKTNLPSNRFKVPHLQVPPPFSYQELRRLYKQCRPQIMTVKTEIQKAWELYAEKQRMYYQKSPRVKWEPPFPVLIYQQGFQGACVALKAVAEKIRAVRKQPLRN